MLPSDDARRLLARLRVGPHAAAGVDFTRSLFSHRSKEVKVADGNQQGQLPLFALAAEQNSNISLLLLLVTFAAPLCVPQSTEAQPGHILPLTSEQSTCATVMERARYPELSEQERWAWNKRICTGEAVVFPSRDNPQNADCDPKNAEEWPDEWTLTQIFFDVITKEAPFVEVLSQHNLQIECAKFEDTLDLSQRHIPYGISIRRSYFPQGVTAVDTHVVRSLSLNGSWVEKALDADRLMVRGNLSLSGRAQFDGQVNFRGATIGGDLIATTSRFENSFEGDTLAVSGNLDISTGAIFRGKVNLLDAKIDGSLIASSSMFCGGLSADRISVRGAVHLRRHGRFDKDVVFRGARIGNQMTVNNSKFRGAFLGKGMVIGGGIIGNERAEFDRGVELSSARIGGSLVASGTTFNEKVVADNLFVDGDLLLNDVAVFKGQVELVGASVSGNIDLSGSYVYSSLDLTASDVGGILILGDGFDKCPMWQKDAGLILAGTAAGALQDSHCSWNRLNEKLNLTGFEYGQFVGFVGQSEKDQEMTADRKIEWLLGWLGKQDVFSSQPYEQLASVLRRYGHHRKADEVIIGSHDRRRTDDRTPCLTKLWLSVKKYTINYGYDVWLSTLWLGGFLFLGVGLGFHRNAHVEKNYSGKMCGDWLPFNWQRIRDRFWFSLDRLVPIIELDDRHKDIHPTGMIATYFHVHRLCGLMIVTLIAAGLSGLIK